MKHLKKFLENKSVIEIYRDELRHSIIEIFRKAGAKLFGPPRIEINKTIGDKNIKEIKTYINIHQPTAFDIIIVYSDERQNTLLDLDIDATRELLDFLKEKYPNFSN